MILLLRKTWLKILLLALVTASVWYTAYIMPVTDAAEAINALGLLQAKDPLNLPLVEGLPLNTGGILWSRIMFTLLGENEFTFRLPGLIGIILGSLVLSQYARPLLGFYGGQISGLMAYFSPVLLLWAAFGESFGILFMCYGLGCVSLLYALQGRWQHRWVWMFAVALAIVSHDVSVVLVFLAWLALAAWKGGRELLRKYLLPFLGGAVVAMIVEVLTRGGNASWIRILDTGTPTLWIWAISLPLLAIAHMVAMLPGIGYRIRNDLKTKATYLPIFLVLLAVSGWILGIAMASLGEAAALAAGLPPMFLLLGPRLRVGQSPMNYKQITFWIWAVLFVLVAVGVSIWFLGLLSLSTDRSIFLLVLTIGVGLAFLLTYFHYKRNYQAAFYVGWAQWLLLLIPIWQLALPIFVSQSSYPRDTAQYVSRLVRNYQDILVVGGTADQAVLYYLARQQETVFYFPDIKLAAQELAQRNSPAMVVVESESARQLVAEIARLRKGKVPLALLQQFEGREMDTYQRVRYQVYTLRYTEMDPETK